MPDAVRNLSVALLLHGGESCERTGSVMLTLPSVQGVTKGCGSHDICEGRLHFDWDERKRCTMHDYQAAGRTNIVSKVPEVTFCFLAN